MNKFFYNVIKKMSNNVLIIGINNEKIIDYINKNNRINLYSIDKLNSFGIFKKNKRKINKGKDINFKKLHKYFNKKSIDYIICDIDEIKSYIKYFIKDSIYLNCNKLYIYGNVNDLDKNYIIKKYKRYNVNIDIKEDNNNYIIIIDNSNSKNKKVMEKFYYIYDTFNNIADFISNVLIS